MENADATSDYSVALCQLLNMLASGCLHLELCDLTIDDPNASARWDPETYTAILTYLNKIDVATHTTVPGPYTFTLGNTTPEEQRLRRELDRLVAKRRYDRKKHLFLKAKGDYAGTRRKQCNWFGQRLTTLNKKWGLGKLTMGSLRLSLAVHLHRQHDGSQASENRICERMNHTWLVQQQWYNVIPNTDAVMEEVEVENEVIMVHDTEAVGSGNESGGSRPPTPLAMVEDSEPVVEEPVFAYDQDAEAAASEHAVRAAEEERDVARATIASLSG